MGAAVLAYAPGERRAHVPSEVDVIPLTDPAFAYAAGFAWEERAEDLAVPHAKPLD